jgi:hypothetical protein
MNREQALDVIKEIFALCHHIEGRSVKLVSPDTNSLLSKGYQVHIETKNNDGLDQCLRMIANHNNLAVNSEGGFLIIYKPQS